MCLPSTAATPHSKTGSAALEAAEDVLEVLHHQALGGGGVARPDCLDHGAMIGQRTRACHLVLRRPPAALHRERGHAGEKARQDRAPREDSQPVVKLHVVLDERLDVADLAPTGLDEVVELGQLEIGRTLRGERGHPRLEHAPRLEQREERVVVDLEHEVDRLRQELRVERADERPLAVPALEDVQGDQRTNRLAQRRPAHAELRRKVALGRKTLPGTELPADDHLLDRRDRRVRDGVPLDRREPRCRPSHKWFDHLATLGYVRGRFKCQWIGGSVIAEAERLAAELRGVGADAAILVRAEDVCYATGFEVPPPIDAGAAFAYGPAVAVVSREGATVLLAPSAYAARSEEMSLADESVLVDGFGHFEQVDGASRFVTSLVEALQSVGTRPDGPVAIDPSWTPVDVVTTLGDRPIVDL